MRKIDEPIILIMIDQESEKATYLDKYIGLDTHELLCLINSWRKKIVKEKRIPSGEFIIRTLKSINISSGLSWVDLQPVPYYVFKDSEIEKMGRYK